MPRIHNTRKERAERLLERCKRGPSISAYPGEVLTDKIISAHYKAWAESWILGDLIDLIPELKKHKGENPDIAT